GIQHNFFSEIHKKYFGIDAAFCIFSNNDRTLCPNEFVVFPKFEKAEADTCLNGFYSYEEFDDIDDIDVFKVGKATGLTFGRLLPINTAISINLTNKSIESAEEQGEIPPYNDNNYFKEKLIRYMKSSLIGEISKERQKCYPTVWFDRQLVFEFKYEDFERGDSGAIVVDKKGKILGILYAAWITEYFFLYAVASPYFAVSEALDVVDSI